MCQAAACRVQPCKLSLSIDLLRVLQRQVPTKLVPQSYPIVTCLAKVKSCLVSILFADAEYMDKRSAPLEPDSHGFCSDPYPDMQIVQEVESHWVSARMLPHCAAAAPTRQQHTRLQSCLSTVADAITCQQANNHLAQVGCYAWCFCNGRMPGQHQHIVQFWHVDLITHLPDLSLQFVQAELSEDQKETAQNRELYIDRGGLQLTLVCWAGSQCRQSTAGCCSIASTAAASTQASV